VKTLTRLYAHYEHCSLSSRWSENYFEERLYKKIHNILLLVPPTLLLDYFAFRIARELLWTNQEVSPVDINPPCSTMIIYHLRDEHWARWWPQFRDVVSPHRLHDHTLEKMDWRVLT
jgi:hypothetical protein